MACGEREDSDPNPPVRGYVTRMNAFAEQLRSRDYQGLMLSTYVFTDETHMSVIPMSYTRGLREVFNDR